MRQAELISEERVRKALSIIKSPGELFEVRIIVKGSKKMILSGYFTDADTLIKAFDTVDLRNANVYVSVNKVNDALYSREQHNKFLRSVSTTSDHDIDSFEWLFVDIDPVRPEGVSSSNEELASACELDEEVYQYMISNGMSEPVRARSGNGLHQLYRISLENTDENKALLEKVLNSLSHKFSNDIVKIDTVNYNPSRIMKLYGTMAQKGANTDVRPHRMSEIISAPTEFIVNDFEKLDALVDEDDFSPAPASTHVSFDLDDFLSRNNLRVERTGTQRDGDILFLEECPFDSSHKNGDARIFRYSNGAIGFKCQHNSCSRYTWQTLREKYEPDAYSRNFENDARIEKGLKNYLAHKQEANQIEYKEKKPKYKIRKLKKSSELMKKELPDPRVFIGVGEEVPLLVEGTCILSAKPKMGKSWLALDMCIKVAHGEEFLGYKTQKCSTLYLDLETSENLQQKRMKKALKNSKAPDNFYLDTETNKIQEGFIEQIEAYLKEDPDIGIIVIDVFQIIRSKAQTQKESEYDHAYRDITPLNVISQKYHVSIILVCHDRKAVDPTDPFCNILGSTGIQGAATQMIVMYKKSKDDPIHISVKGKTIDGLPELDVKLQDGGFDLYGGDIVGDRSKIMEAISKIADDNNLSKTYKTANEIREIGNEGYEQKIRLSSQKINSLIYDKIDDKTFSSMNIEVKPVRNGSGGFKWSIKKFC